MHACASHAAPPGKSFLWGLKPYKLLPASDRRGDVDCFAISNYRKGSAEAEDDRFRKMHQISRNYVVLRTHTFPLRGVFLMSNQLYLQVGARSSTTRDSSDRILSTTGITYVSDLGRSNAGSALRH